MCTWSMWQAFRKGGLLTPHRGVEMRPCCFWSNSQQSHPLRIATVSDEVSRLPSILRKGRHTCLRVCTALLLGVFVFSLAGGRATNGYRFAQRALQQHAASPSASDLVSPVSQSQLAGAGGMGEETTTPEGATAACSSPNPLDPTCWAELAAKAMAQWLAQAILSALQPLIENIDHNSLNLLTQTPLLGQMSQAALHWTQPSWRSGTGQ